MFRSPTTALRTARATAIAATVLAAVALPATASAGVALSSSGWEWSDPTPQGYSLTNIKFIGNRGYAVGVGGTVLRTDDAGATWTGLFTGTSAPVEAVDVIDANTIVLATGAPGGCVLRISKDAGATFSSVAIGDSDDNCGSSGFLSNDFVSASTGYVMRNGGAVLKTTDGAASFTNASTVDGGSGLRFVDEQTGYAIGGTKVYRTTDGAQTWNPIDTASGELKRIAVIDAQHIVVWGDGFLARTADGGATWDTGPLPGMPTTASWSDPQHLSFVVANKLVLSDDGGLTNREVTLGNNDVQAAAFVDPSHIVAVGKNGVTYASTDAGATFTRLSSEPVATALDSIRESDGGPVGLGTGKIGRLVDGHWVLRATLSSSRVIDAAFSSATSGYELNEGGSLYRTATNGVSWTRVDPGTPAAASAVVTPGDASVVLVGSFGVYRATDGGSFDRVTGKTLSGVKLNTARSLQKRITAWRGGFKKATAVRSSDGGVTWSKVALPKGVTRVDDLRPIPGKGLLLESSGRLWRSPSDKPKWTELSSLGTSVADSPGIRAASATEFFAGDGADWSSPVVLHSTDAGKTWQPQSVGIAGSRVQSLISTGPSSAFALSAGSGLANVLFATTTGGSRGTATTLSLSRTKSKLKRSAGKIQIAGQLAGGRGGELVRVALRKVGSSTWQSREISVGSNGGGSFSTSLTAKKGKYVVVAQWAGDSGRAGAGTSAKSLTVK